MVLSFMIETVFAIFGVITACIAISAFVLLIKDGKPSKCA